MLPNSSDEIVRRRANPQTEEMFLDLIHGSGIPSTIFRIRQPFMDVPPSKIPSTRKMFLGLTVHWGLDGRRSASEFLDGSPSQERGIAGPDHPIIHYTGSHAFFVCQDNGPSAARNTKDLGITKTRARVLSESQRMRYKWA